MFFHRYVNLRKSINYIWEIEKLNGSLGTCFKDLVKQWVNYFGMIYHDNRISIMISNFFPSFINFEET